METKRGLFFVFEKERETRETSNKVKRSTQESIKRLEKELEGEKTCACTREKNDKT